MHRYGIFSRLEPNPNGNSARYGALPVQLSHGNSYLAKDLLVDLIAINLFTWTSPYYNQSGSRPCKYKAALCSARLSR